VVARIIFDYKKQEGGIGGMGGLQIAAIKGNKKIKTKTKI
jgi:hypothetical protein